MKRQDLRVDIKEDELIGSKGVNTKVWYNNPWNYVRQMRDHASKYLTTWDNNLLIRRNINPVAFLNLNLGVNSGWKALVINRDTSEAVLYEAGKPQHTAVYRCWDASQHSQDLLIKMIENPAIDHKLASDFSRKYNPVPGQDHKVIIIGLGGMQSRYWMNVAYNIAGIQQECPSVELMLTGSYSYDVMFGKGFKHVSADPLTVAKSNGEVFLPSGRRIQALDSELAKHDYWIRILGFKLQELGSDFYNMVCYNINSLEWASRYYTTLEKHVPVTPPARGISSPVLDWRSPEARDFLSSNKLIYTHRIAQKETDKIACDSCSLWATCKYYRKGSICSVPDSEMKKVAEMFGSRDAEDIIDAMGKLLKVNSQRIDDAVQREQFEDALDPELTKVINSTIANAEKLAKLRNPELAATSKTSVTINNQQNSLTAVPGRNDNSITPAVAMHIVNQLEAQGYKREEITEDLIQDYLSKLTAQNNSRTIKELPNRNI